MPGVEILVRDSSGWGCTKGEAEPEEPFTTTSLMSWSEDSRQNCEFQTNPDGRNRDADRRGRHAFVTGI